MSKLHICQNVIIKTVQNIIFTVPSSSIRNLENPTVILKLWDLIITANHELRGTDAKNTWRERIVVDVQPLGGSMNSGYPIVISYGKKLF
jgi:hypothetical protein